MGRVASCLAAASVALTLGAVSVPAPALAHDHAPPVATIVTPGDSAPGDLYDSRWAHKYGPVCSAAPAKESGYVNDPVRWLPGDDLAIRFATSRRPHSVLVNGYLVGDPTAGVPIFGQVDVPHELRRTRVDGAVVWEAVLEAPPSADFYVDATATWKDVDGCGTQTASWGFRAGMLPI